MKTGLEIIKKVLATIISTEKEEKYTPILFQPEKPDQLKEINAENK